MNIARKFLSMFSQEIVEAGLEFVEKSSYWQYLLFLFVDTDDSNY
jgi:hypothetical protein